MLNSSKDIELRRLVNSQSRTAISTFCRSWVAYWTLDAGSIATRTTDSTSADNSGAWERTYVRHSIR